MNNDSSPSPYGDASSDTPGRQLCHCLLAIFSLRNIAITLVIVVAIILWFRANTRRPVICLVPSGYVGWIRITYREPGMPPLPIRNGCYEARIPENGNLRTSSVMEDGWAPDQFFYVKTMDEIQRNRLFGDSWEPNGKHHDVFIGTGEQFDKAGDLLNGYHTPGRIDPNLLR